MNNILTSACSKQRSGALHLTQKVDYGITLLIYLAKEQPGSTISIKKVAQESHLSFLFLQKIARGLQKAGIIKAERGKFGGYSLIKSPAELSLKEIIEALEGQIALVPCLKTGEENVCKHISYCLVRPTMYKINAEIQDSLLNKRLTNFIPVNS